MISLSDATGRKTVNEAFNGYVIKLIDWVKEDRESDNSCENRLLDSLMH